MLETIEELIVAARAQGLRITAEGATLDASGLDSLVLHARDETGVSWIVRAPRRPDVIEGARHEARTLAFVRPRLPVAVPDWRVHTDELVAYPRLPGTPAWTYDPTAGLTWNGLDPTRPATTFVDSVARFLAAMSTLSVEDARAAGVRVRSSAEVRQALAKVMDGTRELLGPSPVLWARWQRWLADDDSWPVQPGFVHGDLYPGHMILDDTLAVTGVIDWTEGEVADPSVDFAGYLACFGRSELDRLIHRYQELGGRVWPRLAEHTALRGSAFAATIADWAVRTNNDAALQHAHATLAAAEAAS